MDDIFDENTDDLDIARLDNTIHKKNIYKVGYMNGFELTEENIIKESQEKDVPISDIYCCGKDLGNICGLIECLLAVVKCLGNEGYKEEIRGYMNEIEGMKENMDYQRAMLVKQQLLTIKHNILKQQGGI